MIKHVVLLKMHDTASTSPNGLADQISQMIDDVWFDANIRGAEIIRDFQHQGLVWDLALFLTFLNEEDRNIYLSHPAHLGFSPVLNSEVNEKYIYHYEFFECFYQNIHFDHSHHHHHFQKHTEMSEKKPARPGRKKKVTK